MEQGEDEGDVARNVDHDSKESSAKETKEIDVRLLQPNVGNDGAIARDSRRPSRAKKTLEGEPRVQPERTQPEQAPEEIGDDEGGDEPRRRRRRSRRRRRGGSEGDESPPRQPQPVVVDPIPAAPAPAEPVPKRRRDNEGEDRKRERERPGGRERDKTARPVEKRSSDSMKERVGPSRPSKVPQPAAPPVHELETEMAIERSLVYSLPERPSANDERKIAMFCDFENIAIGVRESEIKKLDINLILVRLLQKGKIIVKKAYADWERYSEYKRPFHEAAIELIDIPQKYYSGKNSADIKMVVDAMDLCYSKEHLDTFVIVSGDSDFSPLVSKLKENNKYVIGIGVKNSSSSLLIDNCDEFIYYEDVWRMTQQRPHLDNLPPKQAEAFGLMSDAMLALMRESKDVLWGSLIKQTMQRMRPSFNESYYGYSTFTELLEDAARLRIIGLKRDQRSGNWVVTGFVVRR